MAGWSKKLAWGFEGRLTSSYIFKGQWVRVYSVYIMIDLKNDQWLTFIEVLIDSQSSRRVLANKTYEDRFIFQVDNKAYMNKNNIPICVIWI